MLLNKKPHYAVSDKVSHTTKDAWTFSRFGPRGNSQRRYTRGGKHSLLSG